MASTRRLLLSLILFLCLVSCSPKKNFKVQDASQILEVQDDLSSSLPTTLIPSIVDKLNTIIHDIPEIGSRDIKQFRKNINQLSLEVQDLPDSVEYKGLEVDISSIKQDLSSSDELIQALTKADYPLNKSPESVLLIQQALIKKNVLQIENPTGNYAYKTQQSLLSYFSTLKQTYSEILSNLDNGSISSNSNRPNNSIIRKSNFELANTIEQTILYLNFFLLIFMLFLFYLFYVKNYVKIIRNPECKYKNSSDSLTRQIVSLKQEYLLLKDEIFRLSTNYKLVNNTKALNSYDYSYDSINSLDRDINSQINFCEVSKNRSDVFDKSIETLVVQYNSNPTDLLFQHHDNLYATETQDSVMKRCLGNASTVELEISSSYDYLLISSKDRKSEFVFPRNDISLLTLDTLFRFEGLFEVQGQPGPHCRLILIRPAQAIAKSVSSWQLSEKGQVKFEANTTD